MTVCPPDLQRGIERGSQSIDQSRESHCDVAGADQDHSVHRGIALLRPSVVLRQFVRPFDDQVLAGAGAGFSVSW